MAGLSQEEPGTEDSESTKDAACSSTFGLVVSALGRPHYLGVYYSKILLGGGRASRSQHSTKAKAPPSPPLAFPLACQCL